MWSRYGEISQVRERRSDQRIRGLYRRDCWLVLGTVGRSGHRGHACSGPIRRCVWRLSWYGVSRVHPWYGWCWRVVLMPVRDGSARDVGGIAINRLGYARVVVRDADGATPGVMSSRCVRERLV